MRSGPGLRCACLFTAVVTAALLGNDLAAAQTPHDCDLLAANPEDPSKVAAGVPFFAIDAPRAVDACRAAVEQEPGVARFQYQLALALGRAEDYGGAAQWARLAAAQGYAAAQADLGQMFANGIGVPQDQAEAFRLARLAAEQGYTPAMGDLGYYYARGLGTDRNDPEAVRWLGTAAERNDRYAQRHLGEMYRDGHGVPPDNAQALRLFRLAAEQGDRGAQTALGLMYLEGRGVARDVVTATKWLARAAEQEEPVALEQLRQLRTNRPQRGVR
jgi:uncharacterized protein